MNIRTAATTAVAHYQRAGSSRRHRVDSDSAIAEFLGHIASQHRHATFHGSVSRTDQRFQNCQLLETQNFQQLPLNLTIGSLLQVSLSDFVSASVIAFVYIAKEAGTL